MEPVEQELSEIYRGLSDSEIASLYADIPTLTDAARAALKTEIERRGISSSQLLQMHSADLRHEKNFDRREQIHRKRVANFLSHDLLRDPKWTIAAILVTIGFALLSELVSRHR